MTAQINRQARFVEKNGQLTQYGWSVLQGVWVSTGGATGGTAPAVDDDAVEAITTGPSSSFAPTTPRHLAAGGAVGPAPVPSLVLGDVGPVAIARVPSGDIGPRIPNPHRGNAHGALSVKDGSSAEATTDTTPRKLAGWVVNGLSLQAIVDATDDSVEIVHDGTYEVFFTASFSGTDTKNYHLEIYVDTTASGYATQRTVVGTNVSACGVNAVLRLAQGEKISVYHWSADGGTAFTLIQGSLIINRIGD